MDKKQAISEMCALRGEVMEHFGFKHATDCMCSDASPMKFQDDGHSLAFIQKAVRTALTLDREAHHDTQTL